MQGYVYLKRKLSGGSILSATIPAVTEEKHNFIIIIIIIYYFFPEVYFATGNREVGAQNLKLQFAVPYHVVSSLSHVHAGKKTLEDGRRSNSYRSAHDELLCSLWGVIFIWFFPLTIFPH